MSDWIWYVWAAIVLISFLIIQIARMRRYGVRGTFSYTVMWRMLFQDHHLILQGESPRRPRVFVYFVVMAPFVWFIAHFGGGGRLG